MAIKLEFINLVVPRKTIEEKYPGGWEQCLIDHKNLIGGRVWFDDHLFRDGAMNPRDMYSTLDEWEELGFNIKVNESTNHKWTDLCVVEAMFPEHSAVCDWLEVDGDSAYLKGTPKGAIIGR